MSQSIGEKPDLEFVGGGIEVGRRPGVRQREDRASAGVIQRDGDVSIQLIL